MTTHKCNKEKEIQDIYETLKKLEPLAELADKEFVKTLKDIVDEKKAMSLLSKKFLKWASIIISIAVFVWQIIKELRR